jgi:hypothetical protein
MEEAMPVHVERITTDLTVVDGELPLSQAQLDKLVALVLARLEREQRLAEQRREATIIRRSTIPRLEVGG